MSDQGRGKRRIRIFLILRFNRLFNPTAADQRLASIEGRDLTGSHRRKRVSEHNPNAVIRQRFYDGGRGFVLRSNLN